jgi:hypothetical protein
MNTDFSHEKHITAACKLTLKRDLKSKNSQAFLVKDVARLSVFAVGYGRQGLLTAP